MDGPAPDLYESRMSRQEASVIRNYNLFGEAGDLPDVVHCETIETRAPLHGWEIAPHRHPRLYQVLLLDAGSGRLTLEGSAWDLGPGTLVNLPVGTVHGYVFRPGTRGLVLTFAAEMLDQALRPEEGLGSLLGRPAVLRARDEEVAAMRAIEREFAQLAFGRAQILRALSALLFGRIAQSLAVRGAAGASARPELLVRFETLIETRYATPWRVADYARALGVTPAHLSRVTRTALGRPASALIEERLMREARRRLVYTNLPVATIAYGLGFEDPAYFSRAFARAMGLSPRAFRSRMTED
jgi:AraC family transcriptional regulator, transcriptional activator of pobA